MTRDELIKQCRYYKGEEECPFDGVLSDYWGMEEIFVYKKGELNEEDASYYKAVGGKSYPSIPFPLLIIFFHFWGKGVHGIKENLPSFYSMIDDYLFIANSHYPEDVIPS